MIRKLIVLFKKQVTPNEPFYLINDIGLTGTILMSSGSVPMWTTPSTSFKQDITLSGKVIIEGDLIVKGNIK